MGIQPPRIRELGVSTTGTSSTNTGCAAVVQPWASLLGEVCGGHANQRVTHAGEEVCASGRRTIIHRHKVQYVHAQVQS